MVQLRLGWSQVRGRLRAAARPQPPGKVTHQGGEHRTAVAQLACSADGCASGNGSAAPGVTSGLAPEAFARAVSGVEASKMASTVTVRRRKRSLQRPAGTCSLWRDMRRNHSTPHRRRRGGGLTTGQLETSAMPVRRHLLQSPSHLRRTLTTTRSCKGLLVITAVVF